MYIDPGIFINTQPGTRRLFGWHDQHNSVNDRSSVVSDRESGVAAKIFAGWLAEMG